MINLRDARITDGLPRIVAAQPWVQVLSAVYGELQDRMLEYLDAGMTFSEVDNCDEGMLDQMAVYLKIEWYNTSADVETKRRIVKSAIEIQRYAGTKKAVREQVSGIYPDSTIDEWFEYGGTPGFWKLNVNITDARAEYHTVEEMESLLGYTKRMTAHLERIIYVAKPKEKVRAYTATAPCGLYCTMSARVRGKIPPQSGRVAALAGVATAGVYAQTGAKLRLEN